MKKGLYVEIFEATLAPFLNDVYSEGYRLMQDNDPKHVSNYAKTWMAENIINWWKTPPKSPDLNPIGNLWHGLKEFVCWEVKPRTKEELVEGILMYTVLENCGHPEVQQVH